MWSEHSESGTPEAFDFVGLNYYSRLKYHFDPLSKEKLVSVQDLPARVSPTKGGRSIQRGSVGRSV